MKFAHIADVHLGGWKQKQMQDLNFQSFERAIDICIKSKLDFILFAGDLFDSAYPPIEILKETFAQFKRLKEAKIPCFIIAGSHDYSVSGKTFLDVLEKAGFCKNVFNSEEKENEIILNPHVHQNIAIYGYPGKKSGLEVPELRKIKLNDAPGMFRIFMLHTTLDRVVGNLPIDSLASNSLPGADYYALGHIHVLYNQDNFVYPGPLFPNNFKELEDLKQGHFVIFDTKSNPRIQSIPLPTKKIESIRISVEDGMTATDFIISELEKRELSDRIILLRVEGELKKGKISDIKFQKIEEYAKERGAYFLLRNTHDLKAKEEEFDIVIKDEGNIEEETINVYSYENPSDFNKLITELVNVLSIEKQEDEKSETFNNRLLDEARRVLRF
jgi:DNA repair exonuclease SbcCD nuclease subunit